MDDKGEKPRPQPMLSLKIISVIIIRNFSPNSYKDLHPTAKKGERKQNKRKTGK
jgi:hypothetical protein